MEGERESWKKIGSEMNEEKWKKKKKYWTMRTARE